MRELPKRVEPATANNTSPATDETNTVTSAAGASPRKGFVDLMDILQEDANPNDKDEEEVEESEREEDSEREENSSDDDAEGDEESSVDYDEFKDGFRKKVEDFIENPEEVAEMGLGLLDVGRQFIWPMWYRTLMFPGAEAYDIGPIIAKSIQNEKDNKAPDDGFNNYEKRLYAKWPKLNESIQDIPFTKEQIQRLARMLAKRIQKVTVAAWMEDYDWLIYWGFIEFYKARNIFGARAQDFVSNKFGL